MENLTQIVVSCSNTKELLACTNDIVVRLGGSLGKEFSEAICRQLGANFDNAHRHFHGRSVADILAEATASSDPTAGQVVAEGNQDGTHFTLFESPDMPSENDDEQGG